MLLAEQSKEILGVDTTTLKPLSNKKVLVQCDYCNAIVETKYIRWVSSKKLNPKTACPNCRNKKREETNQLLYGVTNISEHKNSIKKRAEKWDSLSVEEKRERQKKVEEGHIKSLGFIPFKNPEFQKKIQDKLEEKTGYRNPWLNPKVLAERKKTFIKKYGEDSPAKNEKVKKKIRKTRIQKGQTRLFDGKDLKTIAKENGYAYSSLAARLSKYGLRGLENLNKAKTDLEDQIEKTLKEIGVSYEFRFRKGNRELDFFLPKYNLGIEADGLYWHSDAKEPNKNYHKEKQNHFKQYGTEVLFFRANEINEKLEIIKSVIKNRTQNSQRVGARKTTVKELAKEEAKTFLEKNHLMGKGQGKTIGLILNNEIVSALQYLKRKNAVEISRFCCELNTTVQGGLSKLLKIIKKEFPDATIISFVDKRYGNGKSLETLGFTKETEHLSFKWVKGGVKLCHRLTFPGNTGYKHGFNKIWDCGQTKFVLNPI